MPAFEMTPDEINKYGDNLSIWTRLLLIQAWAPLLGYAQQYINAIDPYAKAVVVSDCCEWLASKTDSSLDNQLVQHLAAILKTAEGERLVRFVVAKAQELTG